MLREALRRLLWLGPMLLIVTGPAFWAVAMLAPSEPTDERLPLFVNTNPEGTRERALAAVRRIASDDDSAAHATLARLGGAALPHVLPALDSLHPDERGRVALALASIARRMGIGTTRELEDREPAVLFWTQFWEEHATDFRAWVVKRTVKRFTEHPSALRSAEVVELDTLALEDLVDAMRPVRTEEDVDRVRKICAVAAHVAGNDLVVPEHASPRDARAVVTRWEAFFGAHRSDYVALTGAQRVAAIVVETQYGHWLREIAGRRFGTLKTGHSVVSTVETRGTVTLLLVLGSLAGYPLGALIGVLLRLRKDGLFGRAVAGAVVAAVSVTTTGLAALVAAAASAGTAAFLAGLVLVLGNAARTSVHASALLVRQEERPHVRTALAFGASPAQVLVRELREATPSLLALAVASLPWITLSVFVAERAFGLHGLGEVTVTAILAGDPVWLMTLSLIGVLTVGVGQIAADAISSALDPRLPGVMSRDHGIAP